MSDPHSPDRLADTADQQARDGLDHLDHSIYAQLAAEYGDPLARKETPR